MAAARQAAALAARDFWPPSRATLVSGGVAAIRPGSNLGESTCELAGGAGAPLAVLARRVRSPARDRYHGGAGHGGLIEQRLASAAAPYQVDDREQDDRAEERDQQAAEAEVTLVDGPGAEQRCQQPAAEHCADDADDDVEKNALLRIGAHEKAREPAHQATDHEPDDD